MRASARPYAWCRTSVARRSLDGLLWPPVTAFCHAQIEDEAALRSAYERV